MPLVSGSRFGSYSILGPLGAGGMGAVYRGHDDKLGRDVAIKVLPEEMAGHRELLARFGQEARSASLLNHPNVITIYDIGEVDGTPYIAMELVDGRSLRELLADGALPLRKVLQLASQIADGLAAAHEHGIVHRDLKPENVMVTKSGFAKILDFGLAKLSGSGGSESDATMRLERADTRPGTVLGTVGYMSPEQAAGQSADFRSDQFSFGAIVYELLTGKRAFQRPTAVETMSAIIREEPPPLAQTKSDVPVPVRWIVERCLAKPADERYGSTRDLARDLQRVRDALSDSASSIPSLAAQPPRRRRMLIPIAIGAALLLAGAAGTAMYLRRLGGTAQPEFHRITFRRGYVSSARFAADGRTILYGAMWEGHPMQAFSTRDDDPTSAPLSFPGADVLAISKNGQLALNLGRHFTEWFVSNGTLAEAPLSGGVAPRERQTNVQEADWLPDGRSMAVVRNVNGQSVLEFPAGQPKFTTGGWISHARVSPDGALVAFIDHPLRGADNGWVTTIDRNGSMKHVSTLYSSAQGLAWKPDGSEIWYTAADVGFLMQLHAITPGGRDRVVLRSMSRLLVHDIAPSGRLLIDSETPLIGSSVFVPGATAERDISWLECSFASDLTPDGRMVVLSEQGEGGGPQYSVYVRPTDGSPATRVSDGFGWGLSQDGKWVVSQSGTKPSEATIVPTGAGAPRQLVSTVGDYSWPRFVPDGSRIYFAAALGTKPAKLYTQSVNGGKPVPLAGEGYGGVLFPRPISPDGKLIAAIAANRKLVMVPVDGGAPVPVPGSVEDEAAVGFTADNRYLFTSLIGELPPHINRIDLKSGQRQVWRDIHPSDPAGILFIAPTSVTPDGQGYAYAYGRMISELFVVDGVK